MAEPSAAPSCPLDVPDEDWAEAVRQEESLTTSGTPRVPQGTLTQQLQHWVKSHDRGTPPTVLRSCRGESHDPGKVTPPPVDDTTDLSVFAPVRMKPAKK